MAVTWSSGQQEVIESSGSDLLVSAAAGSGKTAVLVEHVIRKITDKDHPVDIDHLLVVTFTNAAAAEMRERIRTALENELEKEPGNEHLQQQLTLVHRARITTIHSFCLDIIRNHFHEIGIDPGFRIADDGEEKLLRYDVADKLMEQEYAKGSPEFTYFTECFSGGTDDSGAEEAILTFYNYSMAYPWPEEWRHECLQNYAADESGQDPDWMDKIVSVCCLRLRESIPELQKARALCLQPDGPDLYLENVENAIRILEDLSQAPTYLEMAERVSGVSFPPLTRKKMKNVSEDKKAAVAASVSGVKDRVKKIREDYFSEDPAAVRRHMKKAGHLAAELVRVTDLFDDMFTKAKRKRQIVDFADLEHLALRALVKKENGETVRTKTALEYAGMFEEVMVDEYQDSNLIQEYIVQSVSGGRDGRRHNRFMVGDVKQSIYRFRQARPELFMEKYENYSIRKDALQRRIDLHRNFRSRAQVLDSVNDIFRRIMIKAVGGVEYTRDAELVPGASFVSMPDTHGQGNPEGGNMSQEEEVSGTQEGEDTYKTEILLIHPEKDKDSDSASLAALEAHVVAQQIRSIVGKTPVWDKQTGTYRPARYRDVVVLLRAVSSLASVYTEAFSEERVPAYTGTGTGYFSTLEVRTVLSCLSVLDNPRQDIELASCLRSPVGNMSDEELAAVRIFARDDDFYTACRKYALQKEDDTAGKLRRFFKTMDFLRSRVPCTPMHELLHLVLDETGYGNYIAAMPAGTQRKANIDMLVQKAADYEKGSYRGLFNFIRYIDNLRNYEVDYGEAPTVGEEADTVRIMTIHKSKGLEFPIVFLCGTGRAMSRQDEKYPILLHPVYGIGCDYVDTERRIRIPTLMKKAMKNFLREESMGEELRVLYVAMTRAREKLYISGAVRDLEKCNGKWKKSEGADRLSYPQLCDAGCYLDLIMPAIYLCGENSHFTVRTMAADTVGEANTASAESMGVTIPYPNQAVVYDPVIAENIRKIRTLRYPYEGSLELPGKLSVSELKHAGDEETMAESEPLLPSPSDNAERRRSTADVSALSGADRGTLYHTVMQYFDYRVPFEGAFVETQLERMAGCGKIHKEFLKYVRAKDIRAFMEQSLAGEMKKAALSGRLHRETPFVIAVPSSHIREEWADTDELVLVQGIIDAWFEKEDGSLTLLDYKTDRVSQPETLSGRYHLQLDYYQKALEMLTEKKVTEKLIYSFALNKVIRLDT